MREANAGWARYVQRLVDGRFHGNQSALAQELGMASSTVTRWIDGATPSLANLHTMSTALRVPMRELLVAAGALQPDESMQPDVAWPPHHGAVSVVEVIQADESLLDEAREHLLNQYQLLRRLSERADSKDSHRAPTQPAQRPLRAVARRRPPRDKNS